MKNVKIYLSGSMSGCSWEEQTKWRKDFRLAISISDCKLNPIWFDPTLYYNFENDCHKTEKEPFNFDLYNLRNSDIVVVNFNNPASIGTAMELILAKEYNKPVIGWNSSGKPLHPWLIECTTRMCDSFEELISHVKDFYLN